MKTIPFSICSSGEFEILAQVIAMTSIADVLQKKHDGERTKCNMKSFLMSEFGDEVGRINKEGLFPNDLQSIHPAITLPSETASIDQ